MHRSGPSASLYEQANKRRGQTLTAQDSYGFNLATKTRSATCAPQTCVCTPRFLPQILYVAVYFLYLYYNQVLRERSMQKCASLKLPLSRSKQGRRLRGSCQKERYNRQYFFFVSAYNVNIPQLFIIKREKMAVIYAK